MEQLQLIQAPYMRECHILGDWAHHADKAIKQLASTGQPFTADDVRPHTRRAHPGTQQRLGWSLFRLENKRDHHPHRLQAINPRATTRRDTTHLERNPQERLAPKHHLTP